MVNAKETTTQVDRAINLLRDKHYRITRPRKAILKVLVEENGPASIEKIHKSLNRGVCDLATVYRCMDTFEELGLVRRCFFHNGTSLFEFNTGDDHHHHIVCRDCRKVERLDVCVAEGLERLVRARGYTNITHMLEFFGTCADCAKKKK